jgi:hypothetical protein
MCDGFAFLSCSIDFLIRPPNLGNRFLCFQHLVHHWISDCIFVMNLSHLFFCLPLCRFNTFIFPIELHAPFSTYNEHSNLSLHSSFIVAASMLVGLPPSSFGESELGGFVGGKTEVRNGAV